MIIKFPDDSKLTDEQKRTLQDMAKQATEKAYEAVRLGLIYGIEPENFIGENGELLSADDLNLQFIKIKDE